MSIDGNRSHPLAGVRSLPLRGETIEVFRFRLEVGR